MSEFGARKSPLGKVAVNQECSLHGVWAGGYSSTVWLEEGLTSSISSAELALSLM